VLRAFANLFKTRSIAAAFFFPIAFIAIGSCARCLPAQTITIRLLNAKTGKPMNNKMVTFDWMDEKLDQPVIRSNDQGMGTVEIPAGQSKFSLRAGPRVGKEPDRIPYIDCNESKAELFIQVSSVLQNGLVLRNTCGPKSAVAKPGEIVFWSLPLSWWADQWQ